MLFRLDYFRSSRITKISKTEILAIQRNLFKQKNFQPAVFRKRGLLVFLASSLFCSGQAIASESSLSEIDAEEWSFFGKKDAKQPILPAERKRTNSDKISETPSVFYGNPPKNDLAAFRIYAEANYLYWQALEENLNYVMKQGSSSLGRKASVIGIEHPFKDGFRIGAGAVFPLYYWQLEFNWTKYDHNFRDSRMQVLGSSPGLIGLWVHPSLPANTWTRASSSWDLDFNTVDFDLLRLGFTSSNFSFTPRMGLKRGWINQDVHIRYEQNSGFYDVRFKNDFRALGLRFGFDTRFLAKWGFSLLASAGTSLLYGSFHTHRVDISNLFMNGGIDFKESIHRFKPMIQGLLALEWSHSFSPAICAISIALGFEGQVWFGQNQAFSFLSSALPVSNFKTNGNLTLQGLTVHARFDF